MTETAAHITSMMFIGMGLILLFLALMQHRLVIKSIEREDYVLLSVNALNRIVIAAILLTGFLGFFTILFWFKATRQFRIFPKKLREFAINSNPSKSRHEVKIRKRLTTLKKPMNL
jgi:hypothetical protein